MCVWVRIVRRASGMLGDVDEERRARLRATFAEAAELYDRVRPSYPVGLVADAARLTGLGPESRVLEIGPGTGQLTEPLAALGCHIIAVELGEELAAVARRRLAPFKNVQVLIEAFEDWRLPSEPFDCVIAATSFHWLDQRVRVTKAAEALRGDGSLAIISTHHVAGGSQDFFVKVQACYERWGPSTEPGLTLPQAHGILPEVDEIERSGWFAPAVVLRYEVDLRYTADEYIALLNTYSGHRVLDDESRLGLFTCIRQLIEERYKGAITKRYLFLLAVSRHLS